MTDDRVLEQRPDDRRSVIRTALIYTPSGLVATGLWLTALSALLGGQAGAILGVVVVGIIAFALDYEAIAALRDLRSEPVTTTGEVLRVWTKAKILFFGRSHYLLVERKVFEVNGVTAAEAREGETVTVRHWPHTHHVISVMREPSRARSSDRPSSS